MPEIITTEAYKLDELRDAAKAKAREEFITDVLNEGQWHEVVHDDFENMSNTLGITIGRMPTKDGRGDPTGGGRCIWFSGFSCQGDGACFEGRWTHVPGMRKSIREQAPLDKTLHRIADELAAVQRRNFYQLTAAITHTGNYLNAEAMDVEVQRDSPHGQEPTEDALKTVTEAMRELAQWLYAELEKEWISACRDTEVDSAIRHREWLFTADGEHIEV